jgi:hypothetical protein
MTITKKNQKKKSEKTKNERLGNAIFLVGESHDTPKPTSRNQIVICPNDASVNEGMNE